MKKSILFAALLALLCSCSDFLNIRTEATMPTSGFDYTKTENIIMPLSAAYASMRLGEGEAFHYISVMEISSDDADKGSTADDGLPAKAIDEFTLDPANDCVNTVWVYFYNMASSANYAIESMDKFAQEITAEDGLKQVAECRGEAKIIRAWAYLNLLRIFGPVPIIDRSMSAEELASAKVATEDELYTFIYNDLDAAISTVESSWEEYPGRYTCWTARALKSRVALYRKDWKEAATQADAVMASEEFSLLPKFRDAFLMKGENSSEILMSIQSSTLGQEAGDAPMCYYAFIQGPRNNPEPLQGWGFNVPSQKLINFLEGRGDSDRLAATVLVRGTKTPEGDEISESCTNLYYNGKVYTPSRYNKWSFNAYGRDYDMRLIRYSEMLLNFAEAMVNGAGISPASGMTAQDALDAVRARVNLPSVEATLDNIYEERHAEFAMEEHRFFDLVRWGKAAAVLGPLGFKAGKHERFPIPTSQRQLNPNLPASAGYTY